MKKKLFLFITVCCLAFTNKAQIAETEPNDNISDSGVQTITSNGSFDGNFSFGDLEYYRIGPNTGGTITVTFNNAPAANGLWLAPYPTGTSLASTSYPGTFTYVLNPASSYRLYTGTGTATGYWKFTITGMSNIAATVTSSDVLCYGGSTGSATVAATGNGPFTYSWSAGGTSSVVTGLSAGNYSVLVTNGDGISITKTLSITQPLALSTNTSITPPACNSSFGTATVTASGGTAPYDYYWSNSQIGSQGSFLYAGTYTVTVSDAYSCTLTTQLTVTEPSPMSFTFAPSGIPCAGGTGSASVLVSGGSGSYTYSWTNGSTTYSTNNIGVGTQSVTITDTYGCPFTMSAVYSDPPALTSTVNVIQATCINPGSATITTSGGTGFLRTYLWSSSATTSVASLNVGTYTVTVKDVNDCITIQTVTIVAPPALSLTTSASSATICAGQTTTLTALSSGGTGAVTYTWITGLNASTRTVAPTTSTNYSVTATDVNGCTASSNVSITALPLPTLSINSTTICSGNSHTFVPSGAASYTLSGNVFTVTPASTTTYSLSGTGLNGCAAPTIAVTVSVNTTPTITANSATICSGNSAVLSPSGATTYSISGNLFTVMPNSTTSYSITGSSNGCVSSNTAVVTVSVNASPTLSVNNATICSGEEAVLTPSGAATYTISGGSFSVNPLITSTYSIQGTASNGCTALVSAIAQVSVNVSPTVTINSATICSGQSATLVAGGAATYTISGGNFTVSPTSTSSYTLTGTASNGCHSANTATANVLVNQTPIVTVNAATLCAGNTATLIPAGASTYSINGGNFTVMPSATTSYSISGTSTEGCKSAEVTTTVLVNALPTLIASSNVTLCVGESATLSVSGATTYSWSSSETTSLIVVSSSLAGSQTYTVTGTDVNGCANSSTVSQVTELCTGLTKDLNFASLINLFPNPSNGIFTVQFDFEGHKELVVLDQTGRVVQSLSTENTSELIDLSTSAKGIYFVRIITATPSKNFKMVIH